MSEQRRPTARSSLFVLWGLAVVLLGAAGRASDAELGGVIARHAEAHCAALATAGDREVEETRRWFLGLIDRQRQAARKAGDRVDELSVPLATADFVLAAKVKEHTKVAAEARAYREYLEVVRELDRTELERISLSFSRKYLMSEEEIRSVDAKLNRLETRIGNLTWERDLYLTGRPEIASKSPDWVLGVAARNESKERDLKNEVKVWKKASEDLREELRRAEAESAEQKALLAAVTETWKRVEACAGGRGNAGELFAYWMMSGSPMPNWNSCSSGSLTIRFDESGNPIDGTAEMDCATVIVTYDPEVVEEGPRVERREECPPAEGPVQLWVLRNIEANSFTGRISAETFSSRGEPAGPFSGSFERIGSSPPYGYRGEGSHVVEGVTFRWQTHPPLRCQQLGIS